MTLARRQTALLTRMFFARMFESDLMPAGVPQVKLVTSTIAGIAMPLAMVPVLLRIPPSRMLAFQYTFAMAAFALLALILWEGIFPDRRDGRVLSVLPIASRTFVLSRLGALGALFGVFAAGSAWLPSLAFWPVGNPIAHFIGLLGVEGFAFFSIVALQCLLLNVTGRATAQRLALVLQIAIVIAVLQTPIIPANPRQEAVLAGNSWWLPSLWFVGLYDVISGRPSAGAGAFARMALAGGVALPALTVLLYAGTYRRLLRRAIEGEPPPTGARSLFVLGRNAATRLLVLAVPNAITRAVCFFTLQTLFRSRRHKVLLAMYLGVAIAMVLAIVVPRLITRGAEGFARPDAAMLSIPLVLIFLTLVGFRALIGIPLEIKANWTFRLREPADRVAAIGGVAAAMIAGAIAPITLLAFAIALLLWGPGVAVRHAAFCGALGLLLAHALIIRLRKLPFTCTYYPGGGKVKYFWPLYLTIFSIYAFTMGRLQADMLKAGGGFLRATAIVLALTVLPIIYRRAFLRTWGLVFEGTDPDALFEGFQLSEGLAAGSPALKSRPTYAGRDFRP